MTGPHKTIDAILMVLDKRQAQIDVYTTTTIMQQVTDTSTSKYIHEPFLNAV